MSENEIIPVSNRATELPNLIHVFCLRKHVSSFADCFTGMVSFFVVYWLLPYSSGQMLLVKKTTSPKASA
ncbi:MAG: hypothetical protein MRZ63_07885 [Anaerostipes sp.]|nr:hypothetical protein [Anaerostipes sp.]